MFNFQLEGVKTLLTATVSINTLEYALQYDQDPIILLQEEIQTE